MNPRNPNIKIFIDFFYEAAKKIRGEKPKIIPGKDGRLVQLALKRVSEQQLEQLALWFLDKKRGMATTIGAMLGNAVLEDLQKLVGMSNFWKEIDAISYKYFPNMHYKDALMQKFQPFTNEQITKIQEEVAALTRFRRRL